jgi:LuxR family maltose regulon positive regulatory protein
MSTPLISPQDRPQSSAITTVTRSLAPIPSYHQLFAELLRLELRGSAADELPALHAAAGWYADHGHPIEAVRPAQAAQDWDLAVPAGRCLAVSTRRCGPSKRVRQQILGQ